MLNEIEIRQLFISDEEWNRTSSSWKELKPLRNFNEFKIDDENEEDCYLRLNKAGYNIPYSVIEQWIYLHYYNRHTVNNYGWIDYRKAHFFETFLSFNQLTNLFVIKDYRDHVERRSKIKPFDFLCIPKDLDHWKTYGTWRTPPVVLDVNSFTNVPGHAELGEELQLIEGHNRLGYLYATANEGMLQVQEHKVFLLRAGLA